MPPLPAKLTFHSWQRSTLFDRATAGPRLTGSLALTMRDTATGQEATGDNRFTLLAAADIAGLNPSAIKHMAPAPLTTGAEITKFAHVDFWEKDLPWRYTPRLNAGDDLFPWMVLLVGSAAEIEVENSVANVPSRVLQEHNLADSRLWAHTQYDGNAEIARILSPGTLPAEQECVAVLVPAFNELGEHSWTVQGESVQPPGVVLPVLHSWRFWTAEAGDFETLAAALHIPVAGNVGLSTLKYRRSIPDEQVDIDEELQIRGAITSLKPPPDSPELLDALDAVQADLDLLNDALIDENTISMPHYGRPWLANPDAIPDGWPADLNDDPRFRGIAGLGVWMGVEAQEALMDAAVQQAGALREAGQHIGHLALGLTAAGGLWARRMPDNKRERLRILGPMMARMTASGGQRVLDRVTSGTSPLDPAVFSGAAQRILRDRSAQTRHIVGANGGISRIIALIAANQPERRPERAPAGLPHFDSVRKEFDLPSLEDHFGFDETWFSEVMKEPRELVAQWTTEYRSRRDELIQADLDHEVPVLRQSMAVSLNQDLLTRIDERISERGLPCSASTIMEEITVGFWGSLDEFFERVLEDDATQRRLLDGLYTALRNCAISEQCRDMTGHIDLPNHEWFCRELIGVSPPEPEPLHVSISTEGLSDVLVNALDPRLPGAPARVRLCSRLTGIDCSRLIPPEFPIGLDFPTWDLLRTYEKEWLLPGARSLEKDSISALQTNPAFIDAYMVGINTRFMSEMRWRDLAVERTCTPLRMFWGQVDYTTQKRRADIEPLLEWSKDLDDDIGALSHQTIKPDDPTNDTGSRLVIAFRTSLFRRYPSTLVYLVRPPAGLTEIQLDDLLKATPKLDMPDGEADSEAWRQSRQYFGPIFAGAITPELTFFAFDVTPDTLEQFWLVLDEPPSELRFNRNNPSNTAHAATFAGSMLDQPTRVAISGFELENQGLNP